MPLIELIGKVIIENKGKPNFIELPFINSLINTFVYLSLPKLKEIQQHYD